MRCLSPPGRTTEEPKDKNEVDARATHAWIPFLSYSIFPPTEHREDNNSGTKDEKEIHARDRMRRKIQWMAGVAELEPPTLGEMSNEMSKLLEKVRALMRLLSLYFLYVVVLSHARPPPHLGSA